MAWVTVGRTVKLKSDKSGALNWGSLRIQEDTGVSTTVFLTADEARLLASELEALADRLDPPKAATE